MVKILRLVSVQRAAHDPGCAKTPVFNLLVESSSQFGESENKNAGDGYPMKAIEKLVLRFLGSHTFSHGLDPKPSFRLTRGCGIRELALADEASEPTIRRDRGLPPIVKRGPATLAQSSTAKATKEPGRRRAVLQIFGGIDFGHT